MAGRELLRLPEPCSGPPNALTQGTVGMNGEKAPGLLSVEKWFKVRLESVQSRCGLRSCRVRNHAIIRESGPNRR
jgi:hypothetical protein